MGHVVDRLNVLNGHKKRQQLKNLFRHFVICCEKAIALVIVRDGVDVSHLFKCIYLITKMDVSEVSATKQLLAAGFYGLSSIAIMMVNKSVLTNYKFPSAQFLGLGQMIAAVFILMFGKFFKLVSFPDFHRSTILKIQPLPLLYFGNLVCGLGGTKQISLPMFTVLRRFTILLTMILEIYVLGKHPSKTIVITVITMIIGSIIAASDDLAFDLIGYIFIFCNDIFTAANNVYIKKHLNTNDLGKYGIIFYNCLFMIIPATLLLYYTGDFEKSMQFESWNDVNFLVLFVLSCTMGFILIFSTTLCTAYNSALTTTVVGCIKNIVITYIGMVFGGDYVFSWTNFVGINISVFGGILYSFVAFKAKQKKDSGPG
ncbi:unnamed protein product [Clavelina lepadiformis]|uniref:Sugar phosphate transporter domain-containing protein n=1 Tax=Clavelina lepadiformis TaxID=159417 RepID=A0ABP0F9C6_CLALP